MWVKHNGLGCPVPWETIVETEDPTGERHTGRADDPMNVCENGNSWIWEGETPSSFEISRYRLVHPIEAKCVGKTLALMEQSVMANYGRGWGDGYGHQRQESINEEVERSEREYMQNRANLEFYRRQRARRTDWSDGESKEPKD